MAKSELSKAEEEGPGLLVGRRSGTARPDVGALKIQSKQDKLLWPLMIGAVVLALWCSSARKIWGGQWWMLPLVSCRRDGRHDDLLRRIQNTVYGKAESQPGAAAWALDQSFGLACQPGVAATTNFDAVHRVVGRCGIVLVGEGSPTASPLMMQEKKKVARVVGDTPIYELIVGDEGTTPSRSAAQAQPAPHRYPMNISRQKVDALDTRLRALSTKTGVQNQMPRARPRGPRSATSSVPLAAGADLPG